MPESCTGWLLDLYTQQDQTVLWLLDEAGERHRLVHTFPASFHAAGETGQLRDLWRWLAGQQDPPQLSRVMRRDVFRGELPVLAATVAHAPRLDALFRQAVALFPDLAWYDGDIALPLRHAAAFGTFPLARCRVEHQAGQLLEIQPLESPWELDPTPPPLRVLELAPEVDPGQAAPGALLVRHDQVAYRLPLVPARACLISLNATLQRLDPDLLLTDWGDTWLLPWLMEAARTHGLPLALNREAQAGVVEHDARTYFSYGQIVYKGRQVQLRGRLHIDRRNALMWRDYGLDGILESARVTGLPVQDAARLSPGTGISAMQIITALRDGLLVPWHKHQAEQPRSALELMQADMGGLVYQPTVGLHSRVGGVDFVSMYPGLMVRFNISPEVPRPAGGHDLVTPPGPPGLVPRTLAPLLEKRIALKQALSGLSPHDCRRAAFKARASAEKWLLVTCFGYLGYKNARFGRIEAHEAVTALGREALLRAKEAAEDLGFTVLHLYVDGLWVQRPGSVAPADFEELLEEVRNRTGLPVALDGLYRWVVFLPSRVNPRVPVPNRYFGVFEDGSLKVRGIEARRHDTPVLIANLQMELLEILARAPQAERLPQFLPQARQQVRRRLDDLRRGRVPLEELVVHQRLSRALTEYSAPSPAARAVWQLQALGREVHPGQQVPFLYTRGDPGVQAWLGDGSVDAQTVDIPRYRRLLLRAAETILQPIEGHFGIAPAGTTLELFARPLSGSGPGQCR